MKLFLSILFLFLSVSAFAEALPCPWGGKNGCPTSFRAHTLGCASCEGCNDRGGVNHYEYPYYSCSRYPTKTKFDVFGSIESYKAPTKMLSPREVMSF
jgi:hypothetical protein